MPGNPGPMVGTYMHLIDTLVTSYTYLCYVHTCTYVYRDHKVFKDQEDLMEQMA